MLLYKLDTMTRRRYGGDIDISNEYSKQQFLLLIVSHIKSQQITARQAKLIGDFYKQRKAISALNQLKVIYIKASNFK